MVVPMIESRTEDGEMSRAKAIVDPATRIDDAPDSVAALEEILGTEFGELAPEQPHRPVSESERASLEEQLETVESAHADAAARLHTLYAD